MVIMNTICGSDKENRIEISCSNGCNEKMFFSNFINAFILILFYKFAFRSKGDFAPLFRRLVLATPC